MTMRLNIDRKSRTSAVLAAALLLGSAVVAGAQGTQLASADARWAPWVGCWQASSRDALSLELAPNKAAPVVCIIPAAGNATIDLVTISGDKAEAPERVDANGSRREVSREGCTGWETAEFSPDSKRIYLHSEHLCGVRTRTSTGIMSILPNGEWLDVQGVKVESHTGVRVVHYGRVPAPPALSADLRAKLEGQKLATTTAVLAASDSVRVVDVIEASRKLDPLVVQTWLAQRGQGFNMDAKRLIQLADAKVPTNVIDVMVALSYPQAFAINLAQADGGMIQTSGRAQVAGVDEGLRNGPTVFMSWDPFYNSGYYGYGYGYGYRYGLYGYNPYGYGNWYGGTPVVIVRPAPNVDTPEPSRGRMVRGSGYTRPSNDGGSSGSGSPRSSTSGGGSSSSGGSGSSSKGSSSSGGGETRTAKPRP